MTHELIKVGKKGSVVVPAVLRRKLGLNEGSYVVVEAHPEGVLIRPVVEHPVEIYSAERRAEMLLSSAVDADDYAWALAEVRRMGLDPARIRHRRPPGG